MSEVMEKENLPVEQPESAPVFQEEIPEKRSLQLPLGCSKCLEERENRHPLW